MVSFYKPLKGVCIIFILLWTLSAHAQQEIRGKVTQKENGEPLAGATVQVKGTAKNELTDNNGEFTVAANPNDILIISYVGFAQMNVKATSGLVVAMNSAGNNMEEVVVTALGVKKETKRIGYAIQEVKAADILKAREPNPVNGLVGKVAGLNVGITGELLGAPTVLLRGNNVTLYVVDGLPINSDTWNISPDDIETFTILKGPAAAALYGNRGINGAILVTTKKGKRNAKGFTVEFNSSTQINKGFIAIPKVQNQYGGGDYAQYAFGDGSGGGINDGDYDVWGPLLDGRPLPQYDSPIDPVTGKRTPTPWVARGKNNLEGFIRAGLLTTNNLSFSTVTDRANVRMSISNTYQRGIVPNTQLNSVNFNLYAAYNLTNNLKVEGNLNYNRQFSPNIPDVNYGPNSIIYNIDIWTGADWNIEQMRNYWQPGKEGVQSIFAEYKRYHNPWFMSYEWLRSHYKNDLYGYLALNYKISKSLEVMGRSNVTTYNINRSEKLPFSAHPYGEEHNHGNYREDHRDLWENNTEVMLRYNQDLGNSGLNISGFVGGNMRNFKYTSNFSTTNQLIVPNVYTFTNTLNPLKSYNYNANMLVLSGYYSIDISFKRFLTISTTGRVDKSSALPLNHNSYFYPSLSFSSVISDYVTLPTAISYFKIRGSYSNVKFGGTSPYISSTPLQSYPIGYGGNYYSTYDGPSYSLTRPYNTSPAYNNQTAAYAPSSAVDPNIKPASRINYETGFDSRFLHNRLGFSASYFNYLDGPQQYATALSEATGLTSLTKNALKTKRTGYELSLQGTPVQFNNGIKWEVLVNWATYKEVYAELPPGLTTLYQFFRKGDRVDKLYGNKEAKTPDGKVIADASGLPLYLPVAQYLGNGDPDWSWGINNHLSYKNVSLSFQFDGMFGGKIQDRVKRKLYEGGRGIETVQGSIGAARLYESQHWQDPGYKGAYDASGNPILGSDLVQVSNSASIQYDPITGVITNYKDLQFSQNKVATKWVQDYVSSFYNDPEHTMVSKTFAKLREIVITYSLPIHIFRKSAISKIDISLVGRNLLYFFPSAFHDIDVDQYPGRDIFNSTRREYNLQTPTTRSYGFNLNIAF
ncbi:MAG: SusC/RagA family TonB-linked outer membrane protein [Flavisolibacter sp.]